jgi:hypothetical protein
MTLHFENNTTLDYTSDDTTQVELIKTEFKNITIELKSISLDIYYNDSMSKTVQIIPLNNNNNISKIDVSLNIDIMNPFSGNIYIGLLEVSNLQLYTQPGYVYDIDLICTIEDNINTIIKNNVITLGKYVNEIKLNKSITFNSSYINKESSGCEINTNASTNQNTGFQIQLT